MLNSSTDKVAQKVASQYARDPNQMKEKIMLTSSQRVASRYMKQAIKIKQTKWKLVRNYENDQTWEKQFKDTEGRITSYMEIQQYPKTRHRRKGWALQFKDWGQNVPPGKTLFYNGVGATLGVDLYYYQSDDLLFKTKEDAIKASTKFLSWLKKNKPGSFMYKSL